MLLLLACEDHNRCYGLEETDSKKTFVEVSLVIILQ